MKCGDCFAQRFRRAAVEDPDDSHDDDPPSLCQNPRQITSFPTGRQPTVDLKSIATHPPLQGRAETARDDSFEQQRLLSLSADRRTSAGAIMPAGGHRAHGTWRLGSPVLRSFDYFPQPAHRSMRNDSGTRFFASYSALAPENLITLAHLSVSSAMRLVYSLGDSASISPPRSAMRVLITGSARTALISWLSVSMISAGVFFGVPIPAHALVSKPGTKSPSVGTPGSPCQRVVAVTAKGRSLPALICSMEEGMLSNMTCTCPAMRSVSAGGAPR